jgi:hypothetical protein
MMKKHLSLVLLVMLCACTAKADRRHNQIDIQNLEERIAANSFKLEQTMKNSTEPQEDDYACLEQIVSDMNNSYSHMGIDIKVNPLFLLALFHLSHDSPKACKMAKKYSKAELEFAREVAYRFCLRIEGEIGKEVTRWQKMREFFDRVETQN